jgi:hypothetical protein
MSAPPQCITSFIDTQDNGAAGTEVIIKKCGMMAICWNITNPLPAFVSGS